MDNKAVFNHRYLRPILTALLALGFCTISYGVDYPPQASGQTHSYAALDDGALQRGRPNPVPRFSQHPDGTVSDHATGLMWLQNAHCSTAIFWSEALDMIQALNDGTHHCSGYSGSATDWRLPQVNALKSLIDFSQADPALSAEHPFDNVQWTYWSSTTPANMSDYALYVDLNNGTISLRHKGDGGYVWPVRGGVAAP